MSSEHSQTIDLTDSPPTKRKFQDNLSNGSDSSSSDRIILTASTENFQEPKIKEIKTNESPSVSVSSRYEEEIKLWYSGSSSPNTNQEFFRKRKMCREIDKINLNTGILAKYTYLKGNLSTNREQTITTESQTCDINLNEKINDEHDTCFKIPTIPIKRVYGSLKKDISKNKATIVLDSIALNQCLELDASKKEERKSLRIVLKDQLVLLDKIDAKKTEKCKTINENIDFGTNYKNISISDYDATESLLENRDIPTNNILSNENTSDGSSASFSSGSDFNGYIVHEKEPPEIPPDKQNVKKSNHVFEVFHYKKDINPPDNANDKKYPSIIYLDQNRFDNNNKDPSEKDHNDTSIKPVRKLTPISKVNKQNIKQKNKYITKQLVLYPTRRQLARNGRKISNFNKRNFMSLTLKYPKRKKLMTNRKNPKSIYNKNNQTRRQLNCVSKEIENSKLNVDNLNELVISEISEPKLTTVTECSEVPLRKNDSQTEKFADDIDNNFQDISIEIITNPDDSKQCDNEDVTPTEKMPNANDLDDNCSKKISADTHNTVSETVTNNDISPMTIMYSRVSTDSALGLSLLNSPSSSRVSDVANLMTNPLDTTNGLVLGAYYIDECKTIVVIQENLVSFWRYRQLMIIFGASSSWEYDGCVERKNFGE